MAATAAMMGLNMLSSIGQANALKDQGVYTEKMSAINARRAELQAEDTLKRGEESAIAYGSKVRQTIGSQKAALAAQGIVVSSGDAAALIKETGETGAANVETIRNNAFREAMGYKMAGQDALTRGRIARATGEFQAGATLLSGGIKALGIANDAGWFKGGGSSSTKDSSYAINTRDQGQEAYDNLFGSSSRKVNV